MAAGQSTAQGAGARSWEASGTPRTRTYLRRTRTCERARRRCAGTSRLTRGVCSRAPSLPARRSPAAGPPVSPPASHRTALPTPYPTPRDASPGTPIKAASRSPRRAQPVRLPDSFLLWGGGGRGERGGAGARLHPARARRSRCFLCSLRSFGLCPPTGTSDLSASCRKGDVGRVR